MITNFLFLICAHMIGDFYFQPKGLLRFKNGEVESDVNWKAQMILGVIVHSLIYTLVFIYPLSFWVDRNESVFVILLLIIFFSHIVVDLLKTILTRKRVALSSGKGKLVSFIVDQVIHIAVIFIVIYSAGIAHTDIRVSFDNFLVYSSIPIDYNQFVAGLFAVLFVLKPSSIIIDLVLQSLGEKRRAKTQDDELDDSNDSKELIIIFQLDEKEQKLGNIIGQIERIIILCLGIFGFYQGIALVLTAKSIARFKQFEDREFAERYLLGTLLSLLFSILAIMVIIYL